MNRNFQAILAIAARDVTKLTRDRTRVVFSFVFPFIFIGILGSSLQANLSVSLGFNLLLFTFLGVLAQTFFQSSASGIISLITDRDNDFAQEMFVAPIPRWAIIGGKIMGESAVSFILTVSIIILGLVLRIPLDWPRLLLILPTGFLLAFLGGSFGVFIMSNLNSVQSAQQVFPLVLFPQFFLAGIFNPIKNLPPVLFVLSRIAPMTYAVDFFRGIYYFGKPEYATVVLHSPFINLAIIVLMSIGLLIMGTWIFVTRERNR
jgi:ABC-2 type transport system permease protein